MLNLEDRIGEFLVPHLKDFKLVQPCFFPLVFVVFRFLHLSLCSIWNYFSARGKEIQVYL